MFSHTYIYIQNPPERSIGHNQINNLSDIFQLWSLSGESCPEGTIPIRRTTEQEILRVDSVSRFGRKDADHSKQEVCIGTNSTFFISIFSISIFWFLFLMIIKV